MYCLVLCFWQSLLFSVKCTLVITVGNNGAGSKVTLEIPVDRHWQWKPRNFLLKQASPQYSNFPLNSTSKLAAQTYTLYNRNLTLSLHTTREFDIIVFCPYLHTSHIPTVFSILLWACQSHRLRLCQASNGVSPSSSSTVQI